MEDKGRMLVRRAENRGIAGVTEAIKGTLAQILGERLLANLI